MRYKMIKKITIAFFSLMQTNILATDFNSVTFLQNYHGDTIKVNIKDIPELFGQKISVRVKGIDTAEIRSKNKCEKFQAQAAKKIVYMQLSNAKKINLKNCVRGKYFRIVCDVLHDDKNLATELLNKNLAIKYQGGKKIVVDWCKIKSSYILQKKG